ncbi:SDR family NAD(P)-dependent oxidoreductase [Streptomyces hawaiiensis]|jgi:ketoreductase|uniref:Ketoacyl reductase n=1 Tax=Streptomyces hawaiiensis TaxID=67305 RepID=A0A6G5RIT7_9ACTN|nr:SDR family NAD(P)-dependent oxidoreductase [Streptomyces hawaiiensis]QCD57497.1 ketoacyl reductase [Streptomyces hawaiiensis]
MSLPRHALVTGGSSGIGKSIAQRLASAGHSVTICGRDSARLQDAAKELSDLGAPVTSLIADVSDPRQVRDLVRQAVETNGPIGILVNNAGRNGGGKTAELTDELWREVLSTNLDSVFYVTREVLARGGIHEVDHGRIINIASTAGKQGVLLAAPYSASKHGVVGFTKAVGKELAPQGIAMNAVCPGYVETPMASRVRQAYASAWDTTEEEVLSAFEAKIPLGRYSTPDEVASLVEYLTTEGAASITAQAFNVCGGLGNF